MRGFSKEHFPASKDPFDIFVKYKLHFYKDMIQMITNECLLQSMLPGLCTYLQLGAIT